MPRTVLMLQEVPDVKSLGMARKVDDLGRIVLPVELRRLFAIRPGDELEISVDEGAILLRKIEARCVFCDALDDLRPHHDKMICAACTGELQAESPRAQPEPVSPSEIS
ncbi:MAG TPA: AbrB/MazE/SpoVT family DNA-binding domain-containing protein [Acidimicrobiales bacterium]|nr:AbrB/MazE/SpoVT family DNA-binding domain-containing protein [Acidimicrobiales bacterium]